MLPLTAGNGRVKEARKLSRRSVRAERRLFLADGPKAVEGALEVPDRVVEVFATPEASRTYAALLADAPVTLVDDRALASLSDSVTPAGLVAVCHFLHVGLADLTTGGTSPVVVCADVRDPGNAGTIIRAADSAGADAVVLTGRTVDLYNPKVVRSTTGSLFHVPVAVGADLADAIGRAHSAGLQVLAADVKGEDLLAARRDGELARPTAWVFGNEARGLADDLLGLVDRVVTVPIYGRAESMNLATAASVCLYESAFAQRT